MKPAFLRLAAGLLASLGLMWSGRMGFAQSVACVGDCGNDGRVSADEIVTGIGIALDGGELLRPLAGDRRHEGGEGILVRVPEARRFYAGIEPTLFTDYDAHRGEYDLNELQLLPGDDWSLWTSLPADFGAIH